MNIQSLLSHFEHLEQISLLLILVTQISTILNKKNVQCYLKKRS
jgi:hypothetical protein